MELLLNREHKLNTCTLGKLSINGVFFCYTLEDKDRGLTSAMPLFAISTSKVFGQTAIPSGRYEVILNMSNRFKRVLPLLLNVKGYEGVRIHRGNTDKDTLGCILVGSKINDVSIFNSKDTEEKLIEILKKVPLTEKIYLTIK